MTTKTEISALDILELLTFMARNDYGSVHHSEISQRGLGDCREGLRGAQYKRHGLLLDYGGDTYFNFGAQELYEDLVSFLQRRVKFDSRARDHQIVFTPNWNIEERKRCLEVSKRNRK